MRSPGAIRDGRKRAPEQQIISVARPFWFRAKYEIKRTGKILIVAACAAMRKAAREIARCAPDSCQVEKGTSADCADTLAILKVAPRFNLVRISKDVEFEA